MRIWFGLMAALLWAGIYLSGFALVSWLLYLPAIGLTLGAVLGICPSQLAVFKLIDGKRS